MTKEKKLTRVINRNRVHDNIQGVLSTIALATGATATAVSIDFYMLKSEADLSAFGAEFYPTLITASFAIFGVTMALKVWGHLANNHFWLRIEFANKLTALAERVDPRRK